MLIPLATLLVSLIAPPRPVGLVLSVRGEVIIRQLDDPPLKKAAPRDFLRPGMQLVVPKDGAAVLVFPGPGVREQLKSGVEVTIEATGVRPADAIQARTTLPRNIADGLRDVQTRPGGSGAGVVVLRSARDEPRSPLVPILGSLVVEERPDFSWPGVVGLKAYQVRLAMMGSDRELWRVESATPRLAYPKDQPALKRGRGYVWTVSDPDGKPIISGRFTVADPEEVREIAEAETLAKGDDPANLLAAQLVLESLGAIDPAISLGERLTRLTPGEPSHFESLAELYTRAGRHVDAQSARSKAETIRRDR